MSIILLQHQCKRSTSTPRAAIGRCWLRRIMASRLSPQLRNRGSLPGMEWWPREEQLRTPSRQTARTGIQTMPPIFTGQTVRLPRIREAPGLIRRTRILSMLLMGIIRPTARRRIRRTPRRNLRCRTSLRWKVSRLRKASHAKIRSKQQRALLQARGGGSGAIFYLGFRQRRAAREFAQGGVADVLQIRDADLAGVETVAGEPAQECEESYARA